MPPKPTPGAAAAAAGSAGSGSTDGDSYTEESFTASGASEEGEWTEELVTDSGTASTAGSGAGPGAAGSDGGDSDGDSDEADDMLLKYRPWAVADLPAHLRVTAIAAAPGLIVLGTNAGTLVALGADGAAAHPAVAPLRKHSAQVVDVSIDAAREHVASLDAAGEVLLQSLRSRAGGSGDFERRAGRDLSGKALRSLAIHPGFTVEDGKPFAVGGDSGQLLICAKTFFFQNRKTRVAVDRCGRVFAVRWRGALIAYAAERAIGIYDAERGAKVFETEPFHQALRPEVFPCTVFWESDRDVTVAWGNFVRSIRVEPGTGRVPVRGFQTAGVGGPASGAVPRGRRPEGPEADEFFVVAAAPLDAERLLLLGTEERDGNVAVMQFRAVDRNTGVTALCEELPVDGAARLPAADQFLLARGVEAAPGQAPALAGGYFVVAGGARMVTATPATDEDKVRMLVSERRFRKAFERATAVERAGGSLGAFGAADVGAAMLRAMADRGDWRRVAESLNAVIRVGDADRAGRWEAWLDRFHAAGQLGAVLPVVPRFKEEPRIAPLYYELLLNHCLHADLDVFRARLIGFEGHYDPAVVAQAAGRRLRDLRTAQAAAKAAAAAGGAEAGRQAAASGHALQTLGECLGLLHEQRGDFAAALRAFMGVERSEVFHFIRRHGLDEEAAGLLEQLFDKSEGRTLELLRDAALKDPDGAALAPDTVVQRLAHRPVLLWKYVDTFLAIVLRPARGGPAARYTEARRCVENILRAHSPLVLPLVIDNDPAALKPLLVTFLSLLNLAQAYALCRERNCVEEAVYVSVHQGAREEALLALVSELRSMPKAVRFIAENFPNEHDQSQLFQALVKMVLDEEARLSGPPGRRFFHHAVRGGDSWAAVAARYSAPLNELLAFNAADSDKAPLPRPRVQVPVNMISSLLACLSSPAETLGAPPVSVGAMDPLFLIRHLPTDIPVPQLADSLERIAVGKRSHLQLMETIIRVLDTDIHRSIRRYRRRATAPVASAAGSRWCEACTRAVAGGQAALVFRCEHVYHSECVLRALVDGGLLPDLEMGPDTVAAFAADPASFRPRRGHHGGAFPSCMTCAALLDVECGSQGFQLWAPPPAHGGRAVRYGH